MSLSKALIAISFLVAMSASVLADGARSDPLPLPRDPDIAVREEFELLKGKGTREALELFIARHPDHPLVEQARLAILALGN